MNADSAVSLRLSEVAVSRFFSCPWGTRQQEGSPINLAVSGTSWTTTRGGAFVPHEVDLTGLRDLAGAIDAFRLRPDAFLIRGAVTDDVRAAGAPRLPGDWALVCSVHAGAVVQEE